MAATRNRVKQIITSGDRREIDKLLFAQNPGRYQKPAGMLLIAAEYGAEETFRYLFTHSNIQTKVKSLTFPQQKNILKKVVNREPLQSGTLLQLLNSTKYRQYFVLHMDALSTKPAAKPAIEKMISIYRKPYSEERPKEEALITAAKAALSADCLDIAFLWLQLNVTIPVDNGIFKLIATKGDLDFIKKVLELPSWSVIRSRTISVCTTLALFTEDPEKQAYLFGYIQKYRTLNKKWLKPVMQEDHWKEKVPNFLNTLLEKDIDAVSIFEAILERGEKSEAITMLQHPNLQNHAEAFLLSALQTSVDQQEEILTEIENLPRYANILSNPPQDICKQLLYASEELVKKRLERYPALLQQVHRGLFIPVQEIIPGKNNIGFLLTIPSVQTWIKQNKPKYLVNTIIATLDVRLLPPVKSLLGNDGLAIQRFEEAPLVQLIKKGSNSSITLLQEMVKIPSFLKYIIDNEKYSARHNYQSCISLGFEQAYEKAQNTDTHGRKLLLDERRKTRIEKKIKVLASIPELIEASACDWIFRESRFVRAHASQIHTNRKALLKIVSGLIFRRSFKPLNDISRIDGLYDIINQEPEDNRLSAFLEATQTLLRYGQPDAIKRNWINARHSLPPNSHAPSAIQIVAESYSKYLTNLIKTLNRKFGFYTEETEKEDFEKVLDLILTIPGGRRLVGLIHSLNSGSVLPKWKETLCAVSLETLRRKRLFQAYCFKPFQTEITRFVGKDHIPGLLRQTPQFRNFSAIIFWFQSAANRGKIADLPIELWRDIWEIVLAQDTLVKKVDNKLTDKYRESLLNIKPASGLLLSSDLPKPKETSIEAVEPKVKRLRMD